MQTSHLPNLPWIYMFKLKSGKILYIWKAKNIKKRVSQYFNNNIWVWKEDMISRAEFVDFIITQTEQEALILENNMIKKYQPRYNTLLKWDNSYTYIKITNEDFPQILLTRFKDDDGAIYVWPKTYRRDLKKMIQFLRQIFLFRWCWKTQFRKWELCSDYTFGLCSWRCNKYLIFNNWEPKIDNDISNSKEFVERNNEQLKSLYNKNINLIIDFFNWNIQEVEKEIINQINYSVSKENYERAAFLRDTYKNIKNYTQKQTIELSVPITWYFYKIINISDWYVFVIVKFYRWKLIDIIKFKESVYDTNFSELKTKLENEFGKLYTLKKQKNLRLWLSYDIYKNQSDLIDESLDDIESLLDNMLESFIVSTSMEKESLMDSVLTKLKEKYKFKNYPYKIECIDISHFSWEYVSWWLSSMSWWLLSKKDYRMYKIKSLDKWQSDDYKSIKEILIRRFKNSNNPYPDLFVIDWWKWQLSIVKKLIQSDSFFEELFTVVDFISIWKWVARATWNKIAWEKEKVFLLDSWLNIKSYDIEYDESDKILIKLRDESHRFANSYRKKQMSKKWKI